MSIFINTPLNAFVSLLIAVELQGKNMHFEVNQFSSIQSLSRVWLFVTPWIAARQASLSITNSRSSLTLTSVQSVMPSSHLILCRPLLLLSAIPPSIRVFSNQSTLHMRWPKYWSFSFNIIPSKEIPGLISFRMDWLDLLAVQGTLKSLLQHHGSKASILWRSAFFTVQLSHPYMTTGKTIALTRRTFVGKVMSLLLNMPSRLVITFLPRSKRLLISWLLNIRGLLTAELLGGSWLKYRTSGSTAVLLRAFLDFTGFRNLHFKKAPQANLMSSSKLQEIVKDREAWRVASMGSQRFRHNWAAEQQLKLEFLGRGGSKCLEGRRKQEGK